MSDLKLILPSMLRFGALLWLGAWTDVGNRLLRPPARLLERGRVDMIAALSPVRRRSTPQ